VVAQPAPATAGPSFPAISPLPLQTAFAFPTATATLGGAMSTYDWFPGHWSCNTAVMLHGAPDVRAGRLWVIADVAHDALTQRFATTLGGKPYRSDETLTYDAKKALFVQTEVDQNGIHIALTAKAPYKPAMTYDGILSLPSGKLYRMRATMSIDATATTLTTSTAFYEPKAKGYVEQSRGECTKDR
jgi:hypothetical protein